MVILDLTPEIPTSQDEVAESLSSQWIHGELSNFDYLMALNALAGRQLGNPDFHPVIPWIIDFTVLWKVLTPGTL